MITQLKIDPVSRIIENTDMFNPGTNSHGSKKTKGADLEREN